MVVSGAPPAGASVPRRVAAYANGTAVDARRPPGVWRFAGSDVGLARIATGSGGGIADSQPLGSERTARGDVRDGTRSLAADVAVTGGRRRERLHKLSAPPQVDFGAVAPAIVVGTVVGIAVAVVLVAFAVIRGAWRRQASLREADYRRRLETEVHSRTRALDDRNRALEEANARLLEASTTDPLTGLRNRRYLYRQVTKDVDLVLRHYRDGGPAIRPPGNHDLLFLMVDLDSFKPVNDCYGHQAGDELLLQVRDVLLDACRSSDDVVRWGGDEFLIVARGTNRDFAATLAERIRTGLSQRVFPIGRGRTARITASIGFANFPFLRHRPDLLSWEDVLGVADAAIYEAKQQRNAWVGIEGLSWQGDGPSLCDAIQTDPGTLAAARVIRGIQSQPLAAEHCA